MTEISKYNNYTLEILVISSYYKNEIKKIHNTVVNKINTVYCRTKPMFNLIFFWNISFIEFKNLHVINKNLLSLNRQ